MPPYKSHWELAYHGAGIRSSTLPNKKALTPAGFASPVAGPYEPMHLGSDPIAQRENPRVEVFMLDEVVSDLMGTKEEQEKRYTDGELP